jgi:hypothetical protein
LRFQVWVQLQLLPWAQGATGSSVLPDHTTHARCQARAEQLPQCDCCEELAHPLLSTTIGSNSVGKGAACCRNQALKSAAAAVVAADAVSAETVALLLRRTEVTSRVAIFSGVDAAVCTVWQRFGVLSIVTTAALLLSTTRRHAA